MAVKRKAAKKVLRRRESRKRKSPRTASVSHAAPQTKERSKKVRLAPRPRDAQGTLPPKATEPTQIPSERDRSPYDGDTAIKLYLREIGQVKLLTPEEEI